MATRIRESMRRAAALAVDPSYSARSIYLLVTLQIPALLLLVAQDWAQRRFSGVGPMLAQEALLIGVLLLNHRGRTVAAGRLFCVSNWALVTCFLTIEDMGSHHIALLGFPVVLMISGLLLDLWSFALTTTLVFLTVIVLTVAEVRGWTQNALSQFSSYSGLFETLVILGFTAASVALFTRDIRRALLRSRDQESRLAAGRTELEQQTDLLRGTSQKLHTAMELAVEGIAHADAAGRITAANSRVAEISGCARAELLGRQFTDFFTANELTRSPVRWDLLDRGEAVTTERLLTRPDGSTTLVEMTSQRLPDRTLQCFIRDISSRKAKEDAVRQGQRLEALGTLAGGVAHDFNNLLTVMHGALDAIDAGGPAPEALRLPLQDLRTVADRARDLTQQLLAFARRQELNRRPLDLRDTLEQNARLLRRVLGPQIELVIDNPATACPVFADAGALAQVITNFAVNARDAMGRGGRLRLGCGCLMVDAPPANSTGKPIGAGEFVRMQVSDTGCGMDDTVRRRLFDPFFTTKAGDKGTGLGLSVSLGIVEQHGGWIEVRSEVGKGSEFDVFLPRMEPVLPVAAAAGRAPTTVPAPAVRGTETILVVEDEDPVRRLAVGALQWCGFHVIEAATGVEALALWETHGPRIQLLLTDVAMPGGMSGVDLAQACRARSPQLPVLITSGYNQEAVSFGEGCWDDIRFLPKPYSMASLAQAARAAIDARVASGTL
ncbi:MAG: response regulator [Opitutaceae bacterium]|nr:response regulator [Opitutaceae bacterium]